MMTASSVVLYVVYPGPTAKLPNRASGDCIRTAHLCNIRHEGTVTRELEAQFSCLYVQTGRERRSYSLTGLECM